MSEAPQCWTDPNGLRIDAQDRLLDHVCPSCGGQVRQSYTCRTYLQGTQWMACLPCDSATGYSCIGTDEPEVDSCGWDFESGLNPDNPRAADNERRRPSWLPWDSPSGAKR